MGFAESDQKSSELAQVTSSADLIDQGISALIVSPVQPAALTAMATFALVGVCVGLAGVLLAALVSSADSTVATGYELNVIAAVVVGGTSLNGGRGTLVGSFTGAIFFTLVSNALDLYGIGSYWQYVATGLVLITALGVEGLRRRFWLQPA
jgi:ribose transport system permease protein